jgi:hypothetical protein
MGYHRDEVEKQPRRQLGIPVDIETRRKKQKALMIRAVERKVRSRAQQIYESRGQAEGQDLQDWFQAESEVLENKVLAKLYRGREASSELGRDPELIREHETCESTV